MMNKKELAELTEEYWDCGSGVEDYIQKLLPEEVSYLEGEGIIPREPADILVQLIGYSWEPLLISICTYKPNEIILILNEWYGEQEGTARGQDFKEHIDKLKERKLIDHTPVILPQSWNLAGDQPTDVFRFLKTHVLPLINEGKRVVVDITGAKKSMVSGAYLFSSYTGTPVSYIDYGTYNLSLKVT